MSFHFKKFLHLKQKQKQPFLIPIRQMHRILIEILKSSADGYVSKLRAFNNKCLGGAEFPCKFKLADTTPILT